VSTRISSRIENCGNRHRSVPGKPSATRAALAAECRSLRVAGSTV
jgi:hypothetical protein